MGMNTMASRGNTTGMFATLFVGVLDLATGRLSYCNAGHEKPIIITGRNMRYLDVTANIPIGVMEEKKYNIQESVIAAGDMILLYTDGLTEAMNADGKLFGLSQVETAICGASGFAEPKSLLDTMSHAVSKFVDGAEQSDDLTMLVIKYKG